VRRGQFRFSVRTITELQNSQQIRDVPVGQANRGIRLSDVATVTPASADPRTVVRLDGKPAVGLIVYKDAGANTVKVTLGALGKNTVNARQQRVQVLEAQLSKVPEDARARILLPGLDSTVMGWKLRTWFLGEDAKAIDAALDDAHHRTPYLAFIREVLAGLRPALADDAIVVLVIGDVELDRGREISNGFGLAEHVWESAAAPEGYALAGIVVDSIASHRKMTKLWGSEAGRATKTDRILVLGASEAGRRRALASLTLPILWDWPPRGLRAL